MPEVPLVYTYNDPIYVPNNTHSVLSISELLPVPWIVCEDSASPTMVRNVQKCKC